MTFGELAEFCRTQRTCEGCPKRNICDRQAVKRRNPAPPCWLDKTSELWNRDISEVLNEP